MDESRFDQSLKILAGTTGRRAALRALAASVFGGAFASLVGAGDTDEAVAKRRQRRHTNRQRRRDRERARARMNKVKCAKEGQKPKAHKPCCPGMVEDDSGRCAPSGPPPACDVCPSLCPFSTVQAAIDAAAPGATITLCAVTYSETITIDKDVTLTGAGDGAGAGATILQGTGPGRVVTIAAGVTATLERLRVTGGEVDGGILNDGGTLTLRGCTVSDNASASNGGGINNQGTLTLIDSNVTGNSSTGDKGGGGIQHFGDSPVTLINCIVSGNSAFRGGGILHRDGGTMTLSGCTVSGNTAAGDTGGGSNGGGIRSDGTLTLRGCLVSGNTTTGNGGGVMGIGHLTLEASSVTGNHAAIDGGGIYNAEGIVECHDDSTVSGNTAGDPPVASDCVDVFPGTGCAACLP